MSRAKNKKSVWEGREESTYQHPWTEGSQIRSYDLHQVKSRKAPHTDGKHSSTDVHTKNGKEKEAKGKILKYIARSYLEL